MLQTLKEALHVPPMHASCHKLASACRRRQYGMQARTQTLRCVLSYSISTLYFAVSEDRRSLYVSGFTHQQLYAPALASLIASRRVCERVGGWSVGGG